MALDGILDKSTSSKRIELMQELVISQYLLIVFISHRELIQSSICSLFLVGNI